MTRKQLLAYGLLGFSKDLLLSFSGGLLMLYLTDSLLMATTVVGGILFLNRLFDAVNDLLAAYLLDRYSSHLKVWYLAGMMTSMLLFVALFSVAFYLPKALFVLGVCIFYCLLDISYTVMDVSYWSLLPRLSTSDSTRADLSTVATFFSSFASFICFTLALPLLDALGGGNQGFARLALLVAVVVAVIVLLTYPHLPRLQAGEVGKKDYLSIAAIFRIVIQNKVFWRYALYFFFFQFSFEWMNAYNIYYFKYSIRQEYFYSIYAITILAQMFGASLYPKLNRLLSKTSIFYLSGFLSIVGMLALFTLGQTLADNVPLMFLAASMKQIGSGLFMVTATHDLALVIEVSERKTGHGHPAILTSAKLLLAKFSTALTGLGIGFGLHVAGYVNNQQQTPSTALWISLQAFGIPILLVMMSLISYRRFAKVSA
ncbi:MFS transporter [Streptococcus marmotae]|uniref:MFS transporter n=1 Tax=Streptococcus marmotae TaxID=1825069 RepID=UPI0008349ABD|nr:MFS transporter [Streptococcus marmotae]